MWINLLALLILVLCIIIGVKRGFAVTVMGFFGIFLAVVITAVSGGAFSGAMEDTQAGKWAQNKIYNTTYDKLHASSAAETPEAVDKLPLPGFVKDSAKAKCEEVTNGVFDAISDAVSDVLFSVMCHAVLFVLLLLIFWLLKLFVPMFLKLPVLKQADKILGAAAGAVNGFFVIYAAVLVLSVIISIFDMPALSQAAQNSFVYNIVYENNFLVKLFS